MTLPSCVFCEIVRGTAQSSTVYADDSVVAFMDIQPVNEGHILIVPRVHAAHLAELDGETGAHCSAWRWSSRGRYGSLRCDVRV